jgi:hypothetical protein
MDVRTHGCICHLISKIFICDLVVFFLLVEDVLDHYLGLFLVCGFFEVGGAEGSVVEIGFI